MIDTNLDGLNLSVKLYRSNRHWSQWRVRDQDGRVLGTIDTRILGAKIPVFLPAACLCKEGISSDFLLEIGTAMTIISREEMSAYATRT